MNGARIMVSAYRLCLLVVIFVVTLSVCGAAADGDFPEFLIDTAHASVGEPATLVVSNRPIVTLRANLDTLTPRMRVERIQQRIRDMPETVLKGQVSAVPGSLGSIEGYFIYLEGRLVFFLLPEDHDPESTESLADMAAQTAQSFQSALRARAEQQRIPTLVRGGIFTLITTVFFALSLWAIVKGRTRALARWQKAMGDRPLQVRGLNVRPYLRAVEEGAIKFSAFGACLFASYLWLTLVLGFFPYTSPWGDGLAIWLEERLTTLALGVVSAIPGLFTVIIIFLGTRLIVQGVDRFFRAVEFAWIKVTWLEAETARATRRLAIVLIWLFALTVAYPYIPGSDSDAFKGLSVLVGLMVSLGSAGFVNQVMSGLVIVYSRSLKPGEYVEVGTNQGRITEIGVLATKLVTPTRQEITIPNAVLVGSSLTNFSRLADTQNGSIIGSTITIGYDVSWRQVHAMLLLAAERTSGVRKDPKPRVLQRSLSDFYVEYQVLISVDDPEAQRMVLSELHGHIQDVFNEFGVQIMSPHFEQQPTEKVWVPETSWHVPPVPPLVAGDSRGGPPAADTVTVKS